MRSFLLVDLVDDAVEPADREHLVTRLDGREQLLLVGWPLALWADQQDPHQREQGTKNDQG